MPILNLYLKLFGYSDDSDSTTTPVMQDIDWSRNLSDISTEGFDFIHRTFPVGETPVEVELPDDSINFLYMEVDGEVALRLNGDSGDTNTITPVHTGSRDGLYFKCGSITSIFVKNLSEAEVSAKIMMGV